MANAFDQFDSASESSNPFDQFDSTGQELIPPSTQPTPEMLRAAGEVPPGGIPIPGAAEVIPEDPSRVNPLVRTGKALGSTATGVANTAIGLGEFVGAGLAQSLAQGTGLAAKHLTPTNIGHQLINTFNRPDLSPNAPVQADKPVERFSPADELRMFSQGMEDLLAPALNVPVVGAEGRKVVEQASKVMDYPNQRIDTFVKDGLITPESGQIAKDTLMFMFATAPIRPGFNSFKRAFKKVQVEKENPAPIEPEVLGINKETFDPDIFETIRQESVASEMPSATSSHPDIVAALTERSKTSDRPSQYRNVINLINTYEGDFVADFNNPKVKQKGISDKKGSSIRKTIQEVLDKRKAEKPNNAPPTVEDVQIEGPAEPATPVNYNSREEVLKRNLANPEAINQLEQVANTYDQLGFTKEAQNTRDQIQQLKDAKSENAPLNNETKQPTPIVETPPTPPPVEHPQGWLNQAAIEGDLSKGVQVSEGWIHNPSTVPFDKSVPATKKRLREAGSPTVNIPKYDSVEAASVDWEVGGDFTSRARATEEFLYDVVEDPSNPEAYITKKKSKKSPFSVVQVGDRYYRVVKKPVTPMKPVETIPDQLPEGYADSVLDNLGPDDLETGMGIKEASTEPIFEGTRGSGKVATDTIKGKQSRGEGVTPVDLKAWRDAQVEEINSRTANAVGKEDLPIIDDRFKSYASKEDAIADGATGKLMQDPETGRWMEEPKFEDDIEGLMSDEVDVEGAYYGNGKGLWDVINNEEGAVRGIGPIGMVGEMGQIFYSKTMKLLDEKFLSDKHIKAEEIWRTLVNGGIGKHEAEASGLDTFFKLHKDERIKPSAVRDWVKSQMVDVKEVELKHRLDSSVPDGAKYEQYAKEPGGIEGSYRETFLTADNLPDDFAQSYFGITDENWSKLDAVDRASYAQEMRDRLKGSGDAAWRDGHSEYHEIKNPIVRTIYDKVDMKTSAEKKAEAIEYIMSKDRSGYPKERRTSLEKDSYAGVRLVADEMGYVPKGGEAIRILEMQTPLMDTRWRHPDIDSKYKDPDMGKHYPLRENLITAHPDLDPSKIYKVQGGEFTKMPSYLQKNAYDMGVKWVVAKAKHEGIGSIMLTTPDRLVKKYAKVTPEEGIRRLYDKDLPRKFEAYSGKSKGEVSLPDKELYNGPKDSYEAKYREFPIDSTTPEKFSIFGNQRGAITIDPVAIREGLDRIKWMMEKASAVGKDFGSYLDSIGVGEASKTALLKFQSQVPEYEKRLGEFNKENLSVSSPLQEILEPTSPTVFQKVKKNKQGEVWSTLPAITEADQSRLLGASRKNVWGSQDIVPGMGGKEVVSHTMGPLDRYLEATETKINAFRRFGADMSHYYRQWRELKTGKEGEFNKVRNEIKGKMGELSSDELKNLGIAAYADMKGGKEALHAMGITEIPLMTPKMMEAFTYLTELAKVTRNRINFIRERTGQRPMPKLLDVNGNENYLPFIRKMNVLREMGSLEALTSMSAAKIKGMNLEFSGIFNPHNLKRNVRNIGIELNPFRAMENYMGYALEEIYTAPLAAKMKEMATAKIPVPETRGSVTMLKHNPALAQLMLKWSDEILGIDRTSSIMAIENPAARWAINKLSQNVVTAMIGGYAKTVLKQPTSLIGTFANTNSASMLSGLTKYMMDRPEVWKGKKSLAYEKSNVLSIRRAELAWKDFMDSMSMKSDKSVKDVVARASFVPMEIMDGAIAEISWNAGYRYAEKVLKLGEKERIQYADDMVERTQGMGLRGAVSPIQANIATKWLTLLQTFGIADFNFVAQDVLGIKNPDITSRQQVGRVYRYLIGGVIANQVYQAMGMTAPFPQPVEEFVKSKEDGSSNATALYKSVMELTEKFPVWGGSAKYGSNLGGVVGQLGTDLPKAVSEISTLLDWENSTKKQKINVALGLGKTIFYASGIPFTNQVASSVKAYANGGSAYEVVMGIYVEAKKESSRLEGLSGFEKLGGLSEE